MADPRVIKLAKVMTGYSLKLKPGQQFWLRTSPLAQELNLAVYTEAVKAGAFVWVQQAIPGAEEAFYKFAPESLLDYVPPVRKLIVDSFDASLLILAEENTRSLAGVDPGRLARARKAGAELSRTLMKRAAEGAHRWCITLYPTPAQAQDADMSLADYTEFVYAAGMLNEDDPVAFWQNEGRKQEKLVEWLKGHDEVKLKGANVDVTLCIKDRIFETSDGKYNFPDGEIFTSPLEDSANGWIRFRYPGIYAGQEVEDIQLWFENGRVVKELAARNQQLLTTLLNTDPGARVLGELGIGTNYGITRFSKNMLFDEKMGGTIHFAVGAGFPECGGKNESGLHWDMLCDMSDSEIRVDGEMFYKDGKFVLA
jgi:aminopeptidase